MALYKLNNELDDNKFSKIEKITVKFIKSRFY